MLNCYMGIPHKASWRLAVLGLCGLLLTFTQPLPVSALRKLAATTKKSSRVFLNTLPLNISITTPVELATEGTAAMYERQAITVVFSRPVIALGSDFNSDLAMRKVPFRLSCDVPGKTRWVTTAIARFDPDINWPTDLDCNLRWNTNLKSFDGTRLQLGDIPVVRPLVSYGLAMYSGMVISELANQVTGNLWSSNSGAPGDKLPEVPPDGRILLDFSYPVNLVMLHSALRLLEGSNEDGGVSAGPTLSFAVRPCYSAAPWVAQAVVPSLDVNTTCAEVEVGPALKPDTWYTLRLPSGSKYNVLSGNTSTDLDVSFAGLRSFRIPMRSSIPADGEPAGLYTTYRRWDMWLPHGLAPGTTAVDLASRVKVCEVAAKAASCSAVQFTLTLPNLATARLSVPAASPGKRYRVYITADPAIKDGFGQGLQASSTELGMSNLDYKFVAPTTASKLAVMEAGVDTLAEWPYITRAPLRKSDNWPAEGYRRNIDAYTVDASEDDQVDALLDILYSHGVEPLPLAPFGAPATHVTLPAALTTPGSGADWTEVRLPLASSKIQVLHTCCTLWYDQYKFAETQVVLKTSISVSVVQSGTSLVAWVTDSVLGGGEGPVADANVTFYGVRNPGTPFLLASCRTNTDGMCMIQTPDSNQYNDWLSITTLVKAPPAAGGPAGQAAGDRYAVLPRSGNLQSPNLPPSYVATMVFDRAVVEPGDSLKVTGFVQLASPSGLTLPPTSYVMLEVSPAWTNDNDGSNPNRRVLVQLNGTTGTFHGEIPVPKDAQMQYYYVSAMMGPPGVLAPTDAPVATYNWDYLTSASFVVASPRPPTAELQVEVTPWVLPTGIVVVNATAVSYIGVSVGGAAITVTWRHSATADVIKLVTDTQGFATASIDLGALPEANRTTAYDSVSIEVEWIGPTRERITKSASVNIADGPAQLFTSQSLYPETPGTSFTVAATITSSADGSEIAGVPVTATLRPAPNSAAGATCATTTTCTTTSGAGWSSLGGSLCRLKLPCVGNFELEACADVPAEQTGGPTSRICSTTSLGRNLTQWAASPLYTHCTPSLTLDRPGGYLLGESPRIVFENPFSHARLLLVWGNDFNMRSQVVDALPEGSLVEVTLGSLGEECRGGCSLTAVLDVPRAGAADLPALPPPAQLPISRVFDPRAPHSVTMTADIFVRSDNSLDVTVGVTAASGSSIQDAGGEGVLAIEPGAIAQITVSVDKVPADGLVEVTVYAVDKAFLDLMPYDLQHPEQQLLLYLYSHIQAYSMHENRIAPGAIRNVFDKLMMRLTQQDPWLPISTSITPVDGQDVDTPDQAFLDSYSTAITYIAGQWYKYYYQRDRNGNGDNGGLMPSMRAPSSSSAAPPSDGGDDQHSGSNNNEDAPTTDSNSGDNSALEAVRRVGDFVVTPLFATALVGPDGRARVNFTAPQNLGTFEIRAYAAAGATAKYGAGEGKVVVRRRLSLTASVPRFVRVGDTFEAGVVVTVGSAPADIRLTLQVQDAASSPIAVVGPDIKTYSFTAGGDLQEEVRFSFSAVAMGAASLTLSASDGMPGGARDSLQLDIPVEGQQGDVWVATSFALAGNASLGAAGSPQWLEGMDLPSAVPGSGGLMLTAGVGYFPAITSMFDNLQMAEADRTDPYAAPALMLATLPAVLSYYGQTTTVPQNLVVTKALTDLTTLTDPGLGLLWWSPYRWYNWWPSRTDIYLNTWALFVVGLHSAALQPTLSPPLPPSMAASASSWRALKDDLAPTWRAAVGRQLVADAFEARNYNYTYSDWNTLAWVRLALGATWTPSTDTNADADIQNTLSLTRMLKVYSNRTTRAELDRKTRIMLSLSLLGMGASNPAPALVSSTVAEVSSALRVQGRTVYVAAGPGSPSASSLDEQALCLLLLVRSGAKHQLIPKLAAYVANPTSSSGRFFYYYATWEAQALAVAALSEYDRLQGSSMPSVDILAEANGLPVLQASFRVNKTRPVSNTTAWEDLPGPEAGQPGELNFEVSGTGEVTVAASLHFVPSILVAFPTYRGLYVESALQMVDPLTGRPMGRSVSSVPLGSVVAFTVQVTTPDDLDAVTLSVLMPGGLEPLDPNLVRDAGSSCISDWISTNAFSHFYWPWWWWPICPSQETRPTVVTFSYVSMRSGVSSVTIKAVAATAGTFVMPPIRASVDQQPEVMGMTAAGSVTVCADCSAPTYALPAPKPKACPDNCNDNGVCNLNTGKCSCDVGFKGAGCSSTAAVRRRLSR